MNLYIAGANERKRNIGWQLYEELRRENRTTSIIQRDGAQYPKKLRDNPRGQSALICCIGMLKPEKIGESAMLTFLTEMVESNLVSPISLTNYYLKCDPAKVRRVILLSSMAASKIISGYSIYTACKAGLNAFVKTAAHEMAVDGRTKIWSIAPGTVEGTPIHRQSLERTMQRDGVARLDADVQLHRTFPNQEMVQMKSILEVVRFCLSGKADQMSGHCFEIANCQR